MLNPEATLLLIEDLVPPTDEDNARTARQAAWLAAAVNMVEPA